MQLFKNKPKMNHEETNPRRKNYLSPRPINIVFPFYELQMQLCHFLISTSDNFQ